MSNHVEDRFLDTFMASSVTFSRFELPFCPKSIFCSISVSSSPNFWMKRADKAVDERDEYRYRLKEKMVENQTLNQELLKYKPKLDKSKSDKQSTGILIALLGVLLFRVRLIK